MYLPVFLVLRACVCVCLCHGVHRQTNRHSREISEIVPAHTHTHAEITRTRLSCGGDDCDVDSLSLLMHIYKYRHTSMHVCLFALLSIQTAGCLTLIHSRFSYNHTYQHAYLCVCICIHLFFFSLFCWVYLRASGLSLCFSLIQDALFDQQPVVVPVIRRFYRAFIASVSVWFVWLSTEILCLSESVYFACVFGVACVCVLECFLCHGVHWQTNRHSREISEIVPVHTRVCAHAEITRTRLSCGGDECDVESLSLLIHIYIHRHTSMHVCLLAFLSIPDSWLPNSDSLSFLIRSYLCVCVCIYLFFFCFAEYTLELVA